MPADRDEQQPRNGPYDPWLPIESDRLPAILILAALGFGLAVQSTFGHAADLERQRGQ
jgi:hypothetical protein